MVKVRKAGATEPVGEAIKSVGKGVAAGAEFAAADNGGDCELDLTSEGFGVDHQPRFTLGGQDVASVEVLVNQHLGSLGGGKGAEQLERALGCSRGRWGRLHGASPLRHVRHGQRCRRRNC